MNNSKLYKRLLIATNSKNKLGEINKMSEDSLELAVIEINRKNGIDFIQESYGQYHEEHRKQLVSFMEKAKEQVKGFDFPFLAILASGYKIITDVNLSGSSGTFGIYSKHAANYVKQYMDGYELNGRNLGKITAVVEFGASCEGLYESLEEQHSVKVTKYKLA